MFACPPLNGVAETLPTPFVAKDVSRSTAYQEEGLESIQRTVLLSRAKAWLNDWGLDGFSARSHVAKELQRQMPGLTNIAHLHEGSFATPPEVNAGLQILCSLRVPVLSCGKSWHRTKELRHRGRRPGGAHAPSSERSNIGAQIITNTILGAPYYNDGILCPKILFRLSRPLYYTVLQHVRWSDGGEDREVECYAQLVRKTISFYGHERQEQMRTTMTPGRCNINIGALIITNILSCSIICPKSLIGFWGILYYKYRKEPPK